MTTSNLKIKTFGTSINEFFAKQNWEQEQVSNGFTCITTARKNGYTVKIAGKRALKMRELAQVLDGLKV